MNKDDLQAISDLLDNKLDEKLEPIKSQIDENTRILRILEDKAVTNKAEHDAMANDIAHIKGYVGAIRKDISNVEIITSSNWNDIAKLKSVK